MAGVNVWHSSLTARLTMLRMASQLRAAVGESFMASEPTRYKEAIIFGITLAWGIEVQAFNLEALRGIVNDAGVECFAVQGRGSQNHAL